MEDLTKLGLGELVKKAINLEIDCDNFDEKARDEPFGQGYTIRIKCGRLREELITIYQEMNRREESYLSRVR